VSNDAKPGDLTICRFPGGYLVGRLRRPETDGIVWEPEASLARLNRALLFARARATREGVAVWMEVDGEFERVDFELASAAS
jgi:hypothetical protein